MLVLSRKKLESFTILTSDGPVRITNLGRRKSESKFGIKAPDNVKVLRDELLPELAARDKEGA